ncbi:MAG: BamA/TamA family outer membrane protein, partial [bacterium]|nr:BamA/TamA family outer membrane protein [bacterium]MDW8163822.1 POTRA domain-containing protein [Candidatus Omnitrophota bacterium]
IRQEYNRIGYKTSQIDYQVEEKEEKCIINISIIERGKGYVQKIIFVGNNQVSERNLRKLLKTKERKMPFIRGIYKEDVFQEDIKRIKDYYNERGFVEVKIEKEVEYKEDGITITFLINEGKRYFTGEIKLEGDIIFNEDEIRKLILLKRGDVFNVKKNEESLKNIHKFYVEKGYIRCNVEFIPEIRGDSLNVTYLIQPGTVYYTEEVKIKGNRITKDKVIRREVKLEPGDEITQGKIKKTFNNLRDTNYFEDIRIYPEFVEEGKANIVVDVKEREKTGIFLIGGGYSTLDKFIGMVSVQQTNFDITNPPKFVGGGQNLSLLFEIGTTNKNYKFSFTEPYFLDRPISLGPDIYRYEITRYDWKAISNGFDLRIGRRWENFNIGFKLLTEKVELTDVDIPSEVEGIKRKNSITTYLTFSNLDSERFPTKGDKIKCGIEFAGLGGDLNFLKTTLE